MLDIPRSDSVPVSRDRFSSAPLRVGPTDPPTVMRGGYDLPCMDCHRFLPPPREAPAQITQHTDIELDHGINDRCYNCHDRSDRDRLALPGGRTIPFSQTPRLCATCHGTTYRDWELGIHGRTAGSWIASHPDHRRLTCTQCHDPHAPAFGPMDLLPGPDTIRMRKRDAHPDEHHSDQPLGGPLKRWSLWPAPESASPPAEELPDQHGAALAATEPEGSEGRP